MNTSVQLPYATAATFIWVGFIAAISFMEAWLKFRAPGVDLPTGLGIGKLVFSALNKVEIVLALIILLQLVLAKTSFLNMNNVFYFIPVLILLAQSVWLIPALDARADMHIQGIEVPGSSLHIYYVVFEVIKVASLSIFGWSTISK